jgi:hypothetical protein
VAGLLVAGQSVAGQSVVALSAAVLSAVALSVPDLLIHEHQLMCRLVPVALRAEQRLQFLPAHSDYRYALEELHADLSLIPGAVPLQKILYRRVRLSALPPILQGLYYSG